jgi:hypothetical protein
VVIALVKKQGVPTIPLVFKGWHSTADKLKVFFTHNDTAQK